MSPASNRTAAQPNRHHPAGSKELPGLLAITTHRRRGQPPFPRQPQTKLTAASVAALLVLMTISRLVRLLSPLRREPPQKTTPDYADQLTQSPPPTSTFTPRSA